MSKYNLTLRDQTTEFLLYTTPNGAIKVEALLSNENIRLTQKRIRHSVAPAGEAENPCRV